MEEIKKSGVKGVTWNKKTKKWIVKLSYRYIGSFDSLETAIQKRREIETTKMTTRFCVVCGKPIPPDRHKNATTCSDACVREKSRRYMAEKYEEYKNDQGQGQKRNRDHMYSLNVFVPQDILAELKTTANERDISLSEYVRELTQQGIKNKGAE